VDYQKIYDNLIEKRRNKTPSGYVEKHHIVPRSLGGTDDPSNLVALTGREHFVTHLLLHKIHQQSETAYALWMMQCRSSFHEDRPYIRNSRMYEWARKEFIKYCKGHKFAVGDRNSQYGTRWICNVDLQENRKIPKDDPVPEGWIAGRNRWKVIQKKQQQQIQKQQEKIDNAYYWYSKLLKSEAVSIRNFVRNSEYNKSHVSFVKMLKKYVPEFSVHHGKPFQNKNNFRSRVR